MHRSWSVPAIVFISSPNRSKETTACNHVRLGLVTPFDSRYKNSSEYATPSATSRKAANIFAFVIAFDPAHRTYAPCAAGCFRHGLRNLQRMKRPRSCSPQIRIEGFDAQLAPTATRAAIGHITGLKGSQPRFAGMPLVTMVERLAKRCFQLAPMLVHLRQFVTRGRNLGIAASAQRFDYHQFAFINAVRNTFTARQGCAIRICVSMPTVYAAILSSPYRIGAAPVAVVWRRCVRLPWPWLLLQLAR